MDRQDRNSTPSRPSSTSRLSLGRAGATTGQAHRHVFEDFERRPVETQPERRVPRGLEGRDPDLRVREPGRQQVVRQRSREIHAGNTFRASLGGRAFGSVADEHTAESRLTGRVQAGERRGKMHGAVPGAEGAREHAQNPARVRRYGARSATPGRKWWTSAPHSTSSTAPRSTQPGRMSAVGVTNSDVIRHNRSRQRRMGCTRSTRSRRSFAEPGKSITGALTSSTAGTPRSPAASTPSPPKL